MSDYASGYTPSPAPRIGDWLSEMFRLYQQELGTWIGQGAVLLLLGYGPFLAGFGWFMFTFFTLAARAPTGDAAASPPPEFLRALAISGTGLGIGVATTFLVFPFLSLGMLRTAGKQLRGEAISVADIFSAGDAYLPSLGAALLTTPAIMVGSWFCYIPGWLMMALWKFTQPLIVEQRMGVLEALRTSWNAVRPHLWMHLLWIFLLGLIAGIGVSLCVVGMAASYPLYPLGLMIAFRDTIGMQGAIAPAAPPMGPPGYGPPSYGPGGYPPPPPGPVGPSIRQ